MSPSTFDSSRRGRGLLAEYITFGEFLVLLLGYSCVSECMPSRPSSVQTLDRGKDVKGLTSNVRDENIIRHNLPESSGINLGCCSSKEGLMVMV